MPKLRPETPDTESMKLDQGPKRDFYANPVNAEELFFTYGPLGMPLLHSTLSLPGQSH